MSRSDIILLFGDYTGKVQQHLRSSCHHALESSSVQIFHKRSMNRLRMLLHKYACGGNLQGVYHDSPRDLALSVDNLLKSGGKTTALQAALLCIVQFSELILHLEVDPEALRASKISRVVLAGLGTADSVVELAFILGIHIEKRSEQLDVMASIYKPRRNCWATLVKDVNPGLVMASLESQKGHGHSLPYASIIGDTSVTISGPPSTTLSLIDELTGTPGSKRIFLPITVALHAPHLPSLSWSRLVTDVNPKLLDLKVQPSRPILSTGISDLVYATTFGELLQFALEDILQRSVSVPTIARCLNEQLATDSCCLLLGPDSAASPMRSFLPTRVPIRSAVSHGRTMVNTRADTMHVLKQDEYLTIAQVKPNDVAIIGMGLRLPGSDSVEQFWDVLEEGRDLHQTIPANRFELSSHYDPSNIKPNTSLTPFGVFIENPGYFDRHLFKMSPREAVQTDPQQRLLLLATHEALEMAGYSQESLYHGRRVGSFIGQTGDDYREVNSSQDIDTYFIPGGMRAFGPGKLHYHFGWDGPSYSIDTACSSSASAIQLAVTSLLARECDMAVGGGVNFLSAPDVFAGLSRGGFLSATGGCKTFDDDADGYCRADAIGVVILKRLSDAVKDRDNIQAVIRGAITNHSADAISITHPHAETQQRLFTSLLSAVNLSPSDISYVEMHGTGTQAGDAIEMTSVTNTLAADGRSAMTPLFIGSVKPNMGHGEGGSGVTSLIKAVMILRKNVLPPHVGIKGHINRQFSNMEKSHIRLARVKTPFPSAEDGRRPRRILVNNFDAAGGNTSIIVEDPPVLEIKGADPRVHHIVTFSGKTKYSTLGNAHRLLEYIGKHPDLRIEDLAYSTTARRMQHRTYRQALVGSSLAEIRRRLEEIISGNDTESGIVQQTAPETPRTVFVFTGQGSQYSGMGSELYNMFPSFRDSIDSMAQTCVSHGFQSFLPLVSNPSFDISQASPVQVQTAIVAVELGMVSLWADMGVSPDAVIGHSIGEFAALCTAGVVSVADCLYIAGIRAMLLAESCVEGTHTMLAANDSAHVIKQHIACLVDDSGKSIPNKQGSDMDHLTASTCEIACINSPKSTVVSGRAQQINALRLGLHKSGIKASILNVPFGFHSSHMDPILDEYKAAANNIVFMPPRLPIVSTALGITVTKPGTFNAGYLCHQTRNCVQFSKAVEELFGPGDSTENKRRLWLEVGPQPICLDLVKSNLDLSDVRHQDEHFLASMTRGGDNCQTFCNSVAAMYNLGMTIKWGRYHQPFEHSLQLLELPTYTFDLQNYWIQYEGTWSQRKGRAPLDTSSKAMTDTWSLYQVVEERVTGAETIVTFSADLTSPQLLGVLTGHRINGRSLCPSSLYAEMGLSVARYTQALPSSLMSRSEPESGIDVLDMEVYSPLILDPEARDRMLVTATQSKGSDRIRIEFHAQVGSQTTKHAKCIISFGNVQRWRSEWLLAASLVQDRINHLVTSSHDGPTHRILRPMAYKLFGSLVDYAQPYHGMREVYVDSKALEATSTVQFAVQAESAFFFHPCWIDSLCHISGFVLNGTETTPADVVYISHGWESIKFSVATLSPDTTYCTYVRMRSENTAVGVMTGDVYILDNGGIIALVQGIKFQRFMRYQLDYLVPFKNPPTREDHNIKRQPPPVEPKCDDLINSKHVPSKHPQSKHTSNPVGQVTRETGDPQLWVDTVISIIAKEVGVNVESLTDHTFLADSGIDSLLSLTIAARINDAVGLKIPSGIILTSLTIADLRRNLKTHLHGPDACDVRSPQRRRHIAASTPSAGSTHSLEARCHLLRGSKRSMKENPPLFLFPDGGGSASSYTWLASAELNAFVPRTIFGLDSPLFDTPDASSWDQATLESIVESFIHAIKLQQPNGPYHFGGWSIGGVFAFHAAARMHEVSSIFLIDPPRVLTPEHHDVDGDASFRFETSTQILKIASLISSCPGDMSDRKQNDNQTVQRHFSGSLEILRQYRPSPIALRGLRVTLVWANKGVLETMGKELKELGVFEQMSSPASSSDWVLFPRNNYGPNGWNFLLPGNTIDCLVVDGDHFSIMKAPAVRRVGEALNKSFELANWCS
ncbi:ketoacyl-synt-domain-containing protein [Xylariaceae sp. FL1272]|nr:ketoacyl-synt-domain-containing protein [Xylariaceae sp. FL1272]